MTRISRAVKSLTVVAALYHPGPAFSEDGCAPVVTKSVPILGTDLVAEITSRECSLVFGHNYDGESVIIRSYHDGTVYVAATSQNLWRITLRSSEANTLEIIAPNQSDIEEHDVARSGVKVLFVYLPQNDPAYRRHFAQWLHHPEEPANQTWWCTNKLPKVAESQRDYLNKMIGKKAFGVEQDYCPQ